MLLGLAGDVMLGRYVNRRLRRQGPTFVWGDLLPKLLSNDLNLINLEAALTTSELPTPKVFNFKCDPVHVESLNAARIDVVNLANNHVVDYGEVGLLETLDTLDRAGIGHVGAGRGPREAHEPVVMERQGVRVGILGYTDNEPGWVASEAKPGTAYLEVGDLNAVKAPIQALREQVDLLVLSYHWGPNMRERPTRAFQQFAHELIDLGVDLIHGHSAHIVQGVEQYRHGIILYDTGDLVDDYYVDPDLRNDRSFLFLVEASRSGIDRLRLVPVQVKDCQVNHAQGREAKRIMERMRQLSAELQTELIVGESEMLCEKGAGSLRRTL